MLTDSRRGEIGEFLDGVAQMSIDALAQVGMAGLENHSVQRDARSAIKLSAADFSSLNKRVTGLLRQLMSHTAMNSDGSYTVHVSDVKADVMGAVQAIVKRDKLSVEQYEAFVGGFREAGVTVPDHPSLSEDR
jgi:hypothetical protein